MNERKGKYNERNGKKQKMKQNKFSDKERKKIEWIYNRQNRMTVVKRKKERKNGGEYR